MRIFAFQHLADAGYRTAGADTAAKAVYRLARLLQNFNGGVHQMCLRVCRVFKLPRNKDMRVLPRHLLGARGTCADALADVAIVVHQNDLSAVVPYNLAALLADRIRHNDYRAVAAHGTNQRKSDTLIAAGRLDDNAVLVQETGALSCENHIVCRAGLYRPADVDSLKFDKNFGRILVRHAAQSHKRRAADGFENIFANHAIPPGLSLSDSLCAQEKTSKKRLAVASRLIRWCSCGESNSGHHD